MMASNESLVLNSSVGWSHPGQCHIHINLGLLNDSNTFFTKIYIFLLLPEWSEIMCERDRETQLMDTDWWRIAILTLILIVVVIPYSGFTSLLPWQMFSARVHCGPLASSNFLRARISSNCRLTACPWYLCIYNLLMPTLSGCLFGSQPTWFAYTYASLVFR